MKQAALRSWGCSLIGAFGLLEGALGQALILPPAPVAATSGLDETLRDPVFHEIVHPAASDVQLESLLEEPLPTREPLPTEPAPTKKTPFTLTVGPVLLLLSGEAIAMSDANIFNSTTNRERDLIYTVTPRLLLGIGDSAEQKETFLTAGFAPSFVTFQKRDDLSDVDYDAFLENQYAFSNLKIGSRVTFERTTGADLDAPGRVSRDLYSAAARVEYALSDRTGIELNGLFIHRDFLTEVDSDEYISRGFVSYLLSPTLQVALGGALGALELADGRKQNYQQPLLRLWFQPSAKLSIRAIGGVDLRQYNEGISDRNAAMADLGIVYLPSPSENTRLSLDAYRRVQSSSSTPGQNYLTHGIIFRGIQRVFRDLYLDLEIGYQQADYYPLQPGVEPDRTDRYGYVRPRVRYNFNDWGSASLFCHWRNNKSNVANRSYDNQHLGIEIALGF